MQKIACEPQVGSDMEVFLATIDGNGIVPCVGYFDGTKEKPLAMPNYGDGYFMQEDNVMCEFNVPPARNRRDGFYIMKAGKQMVTEEAAKKGLHPVWGQANFEFTPKQLDSKQAQVIGCESDNDAYTGGTARTVVPALTNWRSCGGHIHLGGDFNCPDFVAALFAELFISLAGQINGAKAKDERSKWYGMPGIYRSKPYGIEYRTPNNQWINTNMSLERTYQWAYACTKWLTDTDSVVIQKAFRAIKWTMMRDYMRGTTPNGARLRTQVIAQAREAGVPV